MVAARKVVNVPDVRLKPINPTLVRCPDGREGMLVERMGMSGIVAFGSQRFVHPYPIVALLFNVGNTKCNAQKCDKYH
jgi:hypothetical protein